MKDACYRIQLVGNTGTIKRMVASLYLVDAKKQQQVVKVCICDDLPHVLNAVESQQRGSPSHELVEGGLSLQVAHGSSLKVSAKEAHDNDDVCTITPQKEVTIPSHAVWESNAAFATDFNIKILRPHEEVPIHISITSQDEHGSDIPLSVPPRIRLTWQPKDVIGVQRIRKTWGEMEERTSSTLPRSVTSPNAQKKTGSLPRYQQPMYLGIEKLLQERVSSPRTQEQNNRVAEKPLAPRAQEQKISSPRLQEYGNNERLGRYGGKPAPVQDKNWNVVTSPRDKEEEDLPQWAKGLGDQFDYDDVVVV